MNLPLGELRVSPSGEFQHSLQACLFLALSLTLPGSSSPNFSPEWSEEGEAPEMPHEKLGEIRKYQKEGLRG